MPSIDSFKRRLQSGARRSRDSASQIAHNAERGLRRALGNRHCIAITGFSGAGKSTLLTSLITQLQYLPVQQAQGWYPDIGHCWLSAKLLNTDGSLPDYPYAQQQQRLQTGEWPEPTRALSRALLEVRVKPGSRWRDLRNKGFVSTQVELWDYPGEWLMDLPLAVMTHQQWLQDCFTQFNNEPRNAMAPALYSALLDLDPGAPFEPSVFESLFADYRAFLLACKARGLHIINPGRYALDEGDLPASLPRFIPLLSMVNADGGEWPAGSWGMQMATRFRAYVQNWVKPFLTDVFEQVDHQLVLVDLLGALGDGKLAMEELRRSLARVLQLFHYGHNSWIDRLLAPKIEQLTFVATKLDCVLPSQRKALSELMRALVAESVQAARFESVQVDHLELSSIAGTHLGERDGERALWVKTPDGPAWLKHPHLPRGWPTDNDWTRLADWAPPRLDPPPLADPSHSAWPSIHMDHLCQLLLKELMP